MAKKTSARQALHTIIDSLDEEACAGALAFALGLIQANSQADEDEAPVSKKGAKKGAKVAVEDDEDEDADDSDDEDEDEAPAPKKGGKTARKAVVEEDEDEDADDSEDEDEDADDSEDEDDDDSSDDDDDDDDDAPAPKKGAKTPAKPAKPAAKPAAAAKPKKKPSIEDMDDEDVIELGNKTYALDKVATDIGLKDTSSDKKRAATYRSWIPAMAEAHKKYGAKTLAQMTKIATTKEVEVSFGKGNIKEERKLAILIARIVVNDAEAE